MSVTCLIKQIYTDNCNIRISKTKICSWSSWFVSLHNTWSCWRQKLKSSTMLLFRDFLKAFGGEGVSPGLYATQLNEQKATNFNWHHFTAAEGLSQDIQIHRGRNQSIVSMATLRSQENPMDLRVSTKGYRSYTEE